MSDAFLSTLSPFQQRWMRSCAVYPVLRWPLTVLLGRRLAELEGCAAPDLDAHVALARLAWFRAGFIPDANRSELVGDMSEEDRARVRSIFEGHLQASPETKRPTRGEVVADEVFTRFMMSEHPSPRERAVDAAIARSYGSAGQLRLDARAIRALLWALAAAIVLGVAAFALTDGWTMQSGEIKVPIPQMVQLPGGEFMMGSPETEEGRDNDEGPQTRVTIAPFQIARTEVTLGQFRKFVDETGHEPEPGCRVWDADAQEFTFKANATWDSPGFAQDASHPVVCVSWEDTQAYIVWLNTLVENGGFRLPTEAEWEYAARGGNAGPTFWSRMGANSAPPDQCGYANGADAAMREGVDFPSNFVFAGCSDGAVFTSAVQGYPPSLSRQ